MNLQQIQDSLPNYAKDIKLNLSSLMNNETLLTPQQFYGTLVACGFASKNKRLLNAIEERAQSHLSPDALSAAKSAAALMAMTNVYYRFTHLVSNQEYSRLPANLRMSVMAQPGIEKLDFELFSLAVSAMNGCGKCMDAHESVLSKQGVSKESIQTVVRMAAIIQATANTLDML